MVNGKRTADDANLDDSNNFDEKQGTSSKKSTASRPMQGDGEDGNKHSIDSDEEEDIKQKAEKYDVLDDDEIEGQEDDSVIDKVSTYFPISLKLSKLLIFLQRKFCS